MTAHSAERQSYPRSPLHERGVATRIFKEE